jgi:nucleotide-binding universal stress UspA family protein
MLRTILVPLDGSPLAEQALGTATLLARETGAVLDIVTVIEPLLAEGLDEATIGTDELRVREEYVRETVEEVASGASVQATGTVLRGRPAEQIGEREKAIGADLIVMTSHARTGLKRVILGSVADEVVRNVGAPVLLLRPEETTLHPSELRRSFSKVLIPLDGSESSASILPGAMDVARAVNARVTVLQVVMPVPLMVAYDAAMPLAYAPVVPDREATDKVMAESRESLAGVAARLRSESGLVVESQVVEAAGIGEGIADYAKAHDMDLIAMSTRTRGASRFFLGSVADRVLRSTDLPMLLHRPPTSEA